MEAFLWIQIHHFREVTLHLRVINLIRNLLRGISLLIESVEVECNVALNRSFRGMRYVIKVKRWNLLNVFWRRLGPICIVFCGDIFDTDWRVMTLFQCCRIIFGCMTNSFLDTDLEASQSDVAVSLWCFEEI